MTHAGYVLGDWQFGDEQPKPYRAAIADAHWNGWAIPSFPPGEVERFAEDSRKQAQRDRVELDNVDIDREADGRVRRVLVHDPDYGSTDVVMPDSAGNFPVGAMSWCWTETNADGEPIYPPKRSLVAAEPDDMQALEVEQ